MSNYFATQWFVVCQAPLSMEFSRHEYWSGLPFSSPGDLPDPAPPALQVGSLPTEPPGKPPRRVGKIKKILKRGLRGGGQGFGETGRGW